MVFPLADLVPCVAMLAFAGVKIDIIAVCKFGFQDFDMAAFGFLMGIVELCGAVQFAEAGF